MMALRGIIAAETARGTFPAAYAFAEELNRRYGPATAGVLFYGSCLRTQTDVGLMLDYYVLVDSYGPALKNTFSALFARLLPPNVYYHEMFFEGRTLRAKVAVISVGQFLHGLSRETFASSLWARFAQPALILYARNTEVQRRLVEGLGEAIRAMIANTTSVMGAAFSARDLWVRAFAETYRAELRPEKDGKGVELVDAELPRYAAVTTAVLGEPGADGLYHPAVSLQEQRKAEQAWLFRRIQGKTLNLLRLVKAAFTFQGGLDYAVWKIERHSGVKVELTDAERSRPLITGAKLLLRTIRKGGLR